MDLFSIFCFVAVLLHGQCNARSRIIGGEVARAGQYPFSAAIYIKTIDGNYFCGGTLFNDQFIITAGQCVNGALSFTIYLGTHNLKSNETSTVIVATEDYILHPEFNPLTLENDIGLIKLRLPVEFTSYIQPLDRLPTSDLPSGAGSIQAIGWGQLNDANPNNADDLHWVVLTTISNDECRVYYGNQVMDSMVCAVGEFNEGACSGDSGSPLVQYIRGVYPVHVGISSFVSFNGCESTDPSGYTRTYPYNDWILANTQILA